jgi:hypothetical protein
LDVKSTISSEEFNHHLLQDDESQWQDHHPLGNDHHQELQHQIPPLQENQHHHYPSMHKLPPILKPLPSVTNGGGQSTTVTPVSAGGNANKESTKLQGGRLLISSPMSDWIQLGINLDTPQQQSQPIIQSSQTPAHLSQTFSRQNSGFFSEDGSSVRPLPSSQTTARAGEPHPKFFGDSLRRSMDTSRTTAESPLMFELLKQHTDSDQVNKVKKSLLLLNAQMTQLQQHSSPTNTVHSRSSPDSSPNNYYQRIGTEKDSRERERGERILSVPSNSAPSSTRSYSGAHISSSTSSHINHRPGGYREIVPDELSALLEADSFEEHQMSSPHLNPMKRQLSSRQKSGIVSQSVDEAWKRSPTHYSNNSNMGSPSSLVSQSLQHDTLPSITDRPNSKGNNIIANNPLFHNLTNRNDLNSPSNLIGQSPRRIGSSGNILKAGGLSLMRENSMKANNNFLSTEENNHSVSGKITPINITTSHAVPIYKKLEPLTPTALSGGVGVGVSKSERYPSNPKSRVSALAAALNAGNAVGKLLADVITKKK